MTVQVLYRYITDVDEAMVLTPGPFSPGRQNSSLSIVLRWDTKRTHFMPGVEQYKELLDLEYSLQC